MSDHVTPASGDPQSQADVPDVRRHTRLRLWPGIALLAVFWLVRGWASIGEFAAHNFFVGMFIAPLVVLLGLLLWWLLASRLRWFDRLLVVGTLAAVTTVMLVAADPSFRGMALVIYAVPIVVTAWPGWLAISFWFPWSVRRVGLLLVFVAVGVGCSLLRIDGMDGDFVAKFSWRWTPTPEQKLLAELARSRRVSDDQPSHGETSKAPIAANLAHALPPRTNSRATGPVSGGRGATAVWRACGSRPIGGNRRRSCGGIASVLAGLPSRWSAIASSRRNSGATMNMSSVMTRRRAPKSGPTTMPRGSRKWLPAPVRGRRPRSMPDGCTPSGPTAIELSGRGQRQESLVARCDGRFQSARSAMGFFQFAAGGPRLGDGVCRGAQGQNTACLQYKEWRVGVDGKRGTGIR